MDDKLIKSITFENIVKELIQSQNHTHNMDKYLEIEGKKYKRHFDFYLPFGLNIKEIDLDIKGNVAVEIKFDLSKMDINKFTMLAQADNISTLVFFVYQKVNKEKFKKYIDDKNIKIIDKSILQNITQFNKMYNDFEEFILENDEEDKVFNELKNSNKSNLSFALGAGCSMDANISNWETLSKALGYELLYSILDKDEAAYFNMMITNKMTDSIFSSFDKISALDAIQNLYETKSTKHDYYKSLQKILYMSYDSPSNANTALMKSICKCILRNRINEVLTYNFDSVLEQALDNTYSSNKKEVETSITNINGIEIYHVHGYIPYDYKVKTDVNNFVFTDKDYYENAINQNNFTNITQKNLFNRYKVVFVGVSFTDGNLKEILRKRIINGGNLPQLYAFYKLPDFEKKGREKKIIETKYKILQQSYFDELGIKIIWVRDYKEIPTKISLI